MSEKILPRHLSHKIAWKTWIYINKQASRWMAQHYSVHWKYRSSLQFWMVRGWMISYVLNPSAENRDFFINQVLENRLVDDNLKLLDVIGQINRRQRSIRCQTK